MRKFVRFCIVGMCNTAVTFTIYYILVKAIGINYMVSSFTGYAAGVLNSFVLNKLWTFRNKSGKVLVQLSRFAVVNTASLGVNLAILYVCVEWLDWGKLVSQLAAIGFSTAVNFAGSSIMVFHEKHRAEDDEELFGYIK